MPARRLPVRPDLDQLRHQAKDLLRGIHAGDPSPLADLREFHPEQIGPADAQLADAQLVLARSYEAASWPRLVQACELVDAIWRDDVGGVRELVTKHPALMVEPTIIRTNSDWGPPMTYAANLGRDGIITMLRQLGASDVASALDRATLQGRIGTARMLHAMAGSPVPPANSLGGPAYTLSASGTELLLELGARVRDDNGRPMAPGVYWIRTHTPSHYSVNKVVVVR